ncbi:1-phosphofructokinase family hexose kinase [Rhodococcus sp. SGAir0479]|uniref:1-phosphofructokinase family hexose kinase n=1 Tax=Rhodococcus sp. SGAir0479 TaxID=2567884 RepID=UPI0010CD55EA|nr:PfkB family carbohydrate kinase [Rhodococcus sp. SGAir0479]QCQ91634.1 phosphofructokinase [Rhodococcus sp. SGAir0479]
MDSDTDDHASDEGAGTNAFVFAPSPLLTVTVEAAPNGGNELHVHPGGQGFWIGRMAAILGMDVHLCGPFGGEPGGILVDLIRREGLTVHPVATARDNGSYIHDRRAGEREVVVDVPPPTLTRHETDDLFSASLAAGMAADVAILGGPHCDEAVPVELYTRLCSDLSALKIPVVADLSGATLTAALEGGVSLLKVSHEDLIECGRAASEDLDDLIEAMKSLHEEGAGSVVISRAADPAIALHQGEVWEVEAPPVKPVDHRGAGDSMTAGLAAAHAAGKPIEDALRLGAASGAVNVTRRGLATGQRQAVERMVENVQVRRLRRDGA